MTDKLLNDQHRDNTCRNDAPAQEVNKRTFMKLGAAAAAAMIAPGVTLYSIGAQAKVTGPATSDNRWGMLINANADERLWDIAIEACKTEQGWGVGHDRPNTDVQWIRKVFIKDPKTGAKESVPVMCQHCTYPPCVDVCPTGASMKRADGIVLVDKHLCIGCRYCMMACPYAARSFVSENVTGQRTWMPRGKGTAEACTMCVHRVDKGQLPACVEAVNKAGSDAIMFGNLNDPNSDISRAVAKHITQRIRADLGVEPGIYYQGI